MKRRLLMAALCASVLAGVIGGVVARATGNLAICAIYTPDDPEWYLFFCYINPPTKSPSA